MDDVFAERERKVLPPCRSSELSVAEESKAVVTLCETSTVLP